MSIGDLSVNINNRQAGLVYNTKKWLLTLRYDDSPTFEFEMSMNNVKRIYKTSSYTETHLEDKNKLARTIIGGVLLGATGAIIGAVSGEGTKEVVDAKYSYICIETYDNQEIIVVCKEQAIANNSWAFIKNLNELIASGDYKTYKKERRKFAKKWLLILAAGILLNILLWTLISLLE